MTERSHAEIAADLASQFADIVHRFNMQLLRDREQSPLLPREVTKESIRAGQEFGRRGPPLRGAPRSASGMFVRVAGCDFKVGG